MYITGGAGFLPSTVWFVWHVFSNVQTEILIVYDTVRTRTRREKKRNYAQEGEKARNYALLWSAYVVNQCKSDSRCKLVTDSIQHHFHTMMPSSPTLIVHRKRQEHADMIERTQILHYVEARNDFAYFEPKWCSGFRAMPISTLSYPWLKRELIKRLASINAVPNFTYF